MLFSMKPLNFLIIFKIQYKKMSPALAAQINGVRFCLSRQLISGLNSINFFKISKPLLEYLSSHNCDA